MLTIYKCPKCGAPVLLGSQLSAANAVTCVRCGFSDYLRTFQRGQTAREVTITPPLELAFLQDMASIAQHIQALHLQGGIDDYIKRKCLQYNLSPWTLLEAVNAYLAQMTTRPRTEANPLRFVRLESGQVRLDDLMAQMREAVDRLSANIRMSMPSAPAPAQGSGQDAAVLAERCQKLKAALDEKEKSYQTLVDAYNKAHQLLVDYGLE